MLPESVYPVCSTISQGLAHIPIAIERSTPPHRCVRASTQYTPPCRPREDLAQDSDPKDRILCRLMGPALNRIGRCSKRHGMFRQRKRSIVQIAIRRGILPLPARLQGCLPICRAVRWILSEASSSQRGNYLSRDRTRIVWVLRAPKTSLAE